MEDLIPLLVIVSIAVVNLLKFASGKGKPGAPRKPEDQATPRPRRSEPTSIEEFFEEIAERLAPKPRELPDWPEGVERPDYQREMAEFQEAKLVQRLEPVPPTPKRRMLPVEAMVPPPAPVEPRPNAAAALSRTPLPKSSMARIPTQPIGFIKAGHSSIPTPTLLRSGEGHVRFDLKTRKQLKQAMIASLVLGAPRAYDASFDTTMAK